MKRSSLTLTLLSSILLLSACGSKNDQAPVVEKPMDSVSLDAMDPVPVTLDAMERAPVQFPASLLSDYLSWTPVLKGDQAFKSSGHGGILVRSYLSPSTADHATKNANPYPLPPGSLLAKAVVATSSTPATEATRVYFMKKEAPGYDSKNGDWSYAVANLKNGQLVYDSKISPKQELCISCHVKFAAYDNAQTVDVFKRQTVGN